MAIKMTGHTYCKCVEDYVREFVCDTEADIASLPECCTKSTALVVATGETYMVNASGEWVKLGGGADDSIVGEWEWNNTVNLPTDEEINVDDIKIVHDLTVYTYFVVGVDGGSFDNDYGQTLDFVDATGEVLIENRRMTIMKATDNAHFIEWLKANATRIA